MLLIQRVLLHSALNDQPSEVNVFDKHRAIFFSSNFADVVDFEIKSGMCANTNLQSSHSLLMF